jgi:hypothetical protein
MISTMMSKMISHAVLFQGLYQLYSLYQEFFMEARTGIAAET